MNFKSPIIATGLALSLAFAPQAQAQKDRQTYDAALARSAQVCPEHSPQLTRPGVSAVAAATLKALAERGYALCPDTRLDSTTPVVWYGKQGVFAWNPASKGAPKILAAQAAAYVRKDDFPQATVVWKSNGKLAEGALVPSFRTR